MIDLGFVGSCYTWTNTRIKERLDRGFCNYRWRTTFPDTFIRHPTRTRFDHCPILLQLYSNNVVNRQATPFKFQAMWLTHEEFPTFVSNTWNSASGDFLCKTKTLSQALQRWNKDMFGHIFQKKKRRILARIGGIQKYRDKYENPFLIKLEADLIQEYEVICDHGHFNSKTEK